MHKHVDIRELGKALVFDRQVVILSAIVSHNRHITKEEYWWFPWETPTDEILAYLANWYDPTTQHYHPSMFFTDIVLDWGKVRHP